VAVQLRFSEEDGQASAFQEPPRPPRPPPTPPVNTHPLDQRWGVIP